MIPTEKLTQYRADAQAQQTDTRSTFDMEAYLQKHKFELLKRKPWNSHHGGVILELSVCPFDANHTQGSAAFTLADGVPGFECKHNGCAGKTISDVFRRYPPNNQQQSEIVLECFDDINAKAVEWDWPERIPRAKLTIFSGDPDLGKSTVAEDIIARFTTQSDWPDGAENITEPGDVLMLIAEDDPEDTVKPRLMAAGADLKRVHLLKCVRVTQNANKIERMLALDTDLTLLETQLKVSQRVKLVVIDPITNYFGRANSNRDQELRTVLVPIKELADRAGVTFIGIGHFNKRTDVSALHRVGGAVAMSGVARAVWMFMKDPEVEGQYLMLLGKGNLTKKRTGLRYRIVEQRVMLPDGKETGVPKIDWQSGESTASADDIVTRPNDPVERKAAKAARWLTDFLANGDKHSEEIYAKGKEAGLSRGTLWAARKVVNIEAYQKDRQWWWTAPKLKPHGNREPGEEG
jgi:putative DNA primase/helicase